jgi:tripartite-type tricarboxylate transporter receptor subunit TctC
MTINRRALLASATISLLCAAFPAVAQDKWPSKPITYIVPFPPGGTTDVLGRLIVPKLATALGGATIIIDNKGGAGGSIGSALAAKAPADGYTLLGGTVSSHAINVSLYPSLGYDPVKSFTPVALIGTNPTLLLVRQDSPFKTLQDVIDAAKAKKRLTSASAGSGTSQHLSLEMLKIRSGIDITHIPYKGSGPALIDTMGGQVDMMFDTPAAAAQHIQSGKLRALAVSSATRIASLPNVPTIAESGVPGYEVTSWQGVFAPAGTPQPIIERLHNEIVKILQEPDMQDRLAKLGMEQQKMSTQQFAEFQKDEVAKWAEVIRKGNIKVE